MTKKIKFQTDSPRFEILKPYPASKAIPDWYRKMKGVKGGDETVKKCVPFLDALTSGYIIPLTSDVTWDSDNNSFSSKSKVATTSRHILSQTDEVTIPDEYNPAPHKWINHWYIKTPKGYSTLFIHPLNREDLPFHSFSGVVDTDKHPVIVHFPFILREDFNGVIPAGTPIIQAIPFKRDDWQSQIEDSVGHEYDKTYEVMMPPFAWYKRKWWSRKRYM